MGVTTRFIQVGDAWMAEVPCQYKGQCELEMSDVRTGAVIGRFRGESNGVVAAFRLSRSPRGVIRLTLRAGSKVFSGICSLSGMAVQTHRQSTTSVLVPVAKVRAAMPGLLLDDLGAKIAQGSGLSVARSSALFAIVAEQEPGMSACRLVAMEPAGFLRFACEVEER